MSQLNTTNPGISAWWGRHSVPVGRSDFWQIGSLRLWIEHLPSRLHLRWTNTQDWLDAHMRHLPGTPFEKPQSRMDEATYVYGAKGSSDLVFSPCLPDRSIVVRSGKPVSVLPGDEVTAYLITPLWVRVDLANPTRVVREIPTYRLSDTWHGPTNVTGELAYSSPVGLLFDPREVPLRSHCVVTPIVIQNHGLDALTTERLLVPYRKLSLYYSSQTGFWTDLITLERREDDAFPHMKIDNQAPHEASPSQFIAPPRQANVESSHTFGAFTRMFERGHHE